MKTVKAIIIAAIICTLCFSCKSPPAKPAEHNIDPSLYTLLADAVNENVPVTVQKNVILLGASFYEKKNEFHFLFRLEHMKKSAYSETELEFHKNLMRTVIMKEFQTVEEMSLYRAGNITLVIDYKGNDDKDLFTMRFEPGEY